MYSILPTDGGTCSMYLQYVLAVGTYIWRSLAAHDLAADLDLLKILDPARKLHYTHMYIINLTNASAWKVKMTFLTYIRSRAPNLGERLNKFKMKLGTEIHTGIRNPAKCCSQ